MNQNDSDSNWPALDKHHTGYKKGEILVVTGGTGGRSALTEQIAQKLIQEGHRVELAGEVEQQDIEKRMTESMIPEYLTVPEVPEHPYGKRRKPKQRKLKRKPRP